MHSVNVQQGFLSDVNSVKNWVTLREVCFVRILLDLIHTNGDTFIEFSFNSVF